MNEKHKQEKQKEHISVGWLKSKTQNSGGGGRKD